MKEIKIFGRQIISWGENKVTSESPKPSALPRGRVSIPDNKNQFSFMKGAPDLVDPLFNSTLIPYIRNLAYTNPDVSQALDNLVQLGNPGHEVEFDESVSEAEANKIRQYLEIKKADWSESTAGMDGLVNKMISQVMIGGALSGEWVPNMDLKGIDRFVFVNPETIQFAIEKKTQKYIPYQRPKNLPLGKAFPENELIKLNPETYKYYALNGDTELPYGIPPYLPSLDPLKRQAIMQENLDFIIEQIGLLGFLTVLMEKPDMLAGESANTSDYVNRLDKDLQTVLSRVKAGMKDGIVAGYKEDTEFQFFSPTKDVTGATSLYENNELQVMSGLKQDASLLGRAYGTSETQITVIFTKILAQLKNIQNLVRRNLEFGYTLDLRLAGFTFKSLRVKFLQSTVLDELKYQQAMEIKIRNHRGRYYDGIDNLDEYAQAMGKEKADQKEPRFIMDSAQDPAELKAKREAQKNKSDKKTRDKNRPTPRKLN